MRPRRGNHEQHDVGEGYAKRDFENSRGTAWAMGVHVHDFSLRAAGGGFKRLCGPVGPMSDAGMFRQSTKRAL